MPVEAIYGFLAHPSKGEDEQPEIMGTEVALTGRLYGMLREVFEDSDTECNTEIAFLPNEDKQENQRRTEILSLFASPDLDTSCVLAQRLQEVTTHRSGMGLMFVMLGPNGDQTKLVISRFPAEHGILAEEQQEKLRVEYLERVFMRTERAYKAALYFSAPNPAEFWDGLAVDKQVNSPNKTISDYWIHDFLMSDFRTTSAAGTKRLAMALRAVMQHTDDLETKASLIAAAKLAPNLKGRSISIESFADQYGLSSGVKDALRREVKNPKLLHDRFRFSSEEFLSNLPYQSVEFDNGAMVTAPVESFDKCFNVETVADGDEVQYTTRGRIINESLRRRR